MSNVKDLENLMRRIVDRDIPGASISVYKDEKPLYEGCFGYMDFERKRPLTPD
ncbi:MAG: serine hydrolase, partial [Oscillospiraceae bacterium]|nr:serine hydrolase [Oscillospiraceae bacterium]